MKRCRVNVAAALASDGLQDQDVKNDAHPVGKHSASTFGVQEIQLNLNPCSLGANTTRQLLRQHALHDHSTEPCCLSRVAATHFHRQCIGTSMP